MVDVAGGGWGEAGVEVGWVRGWPPHSKFFLDWPDSRVYKLLLIAACAGRMVVMESDDAPAGTSQSPHGQPVVVRSPPLRIAAEQAALDQAIEDACEADAAMFERYFGPGHQEGG